MSSSSEEFEHDSEHELVDLTDHHTSPKHHGSRKTTTTPPPSAPQAAMNPMPSVPPPKINETQPAEDMQNLNGDLQALQGQRAEIAQMQAELETLRAHTTAVTQQTGKDGSLDPDEVRRATEAVNHITSSLGSFETKLENIVASPVRQRRVQEVAPKSPEQDVPVASNGAMIISNKDNTTTSQLEQMRQLQEMQSALESLEQHLSTVSVNGDGGSITDVALLQEQMEMIQGVMGQLGAMNEYGEEGNDGSITEGSNDVGGLGGAMLSSLNRKMEVLAGSPQSNAAYTVENDEKDDEKDGEGYVGNEEGPTFDEIMLLFKSHGLEMGREELNAMLNTDQGAQLVQQVLELSSLRVEQEKQLQELNSHNEADANVDEKEKNSAAASTSTSAPASTSGTQTGGTTVSATAPDVVVAIDQHSRDKDNVHRLFLERGYSLSDEDLEQTLSTDRGKALANKLRELNPTQLDTFSKSAGVEPIPAADVTTTVATANDSHINTADATDATVESEELRQPSTSSAPSNTSGNSSKADADAVRELLSSRGISLTDEQLVEVMTTERGQEMASQLRELRETREQLQQAELATGSSTNTNQDRNFLRNFLQQQREGVPITDEEVDAVLATDQGRRLLAQLKELQSAEREQQVLQAALQARIAEEEQGKNATEHSTDGGITTAERNYLKTLIHSQKGVDVSDAQLNELLATPMGMNMVDQVRQLLQAQKNAEKAEKSFQTSSGSNINGNSNSNSNEGALAAPINEQDRQQVSDLFFEQRGTRLSEEDLDRVIGSDMGRQLAMQLREVKEEERKHRATHERDEEDEEEEDEALLDTSDSTKLSKMQNRRAYVRSLLVKEGAGGALASVTDEELDVILSTERGSALVEQLERASQQRAELESLRSQKEANMKMGKEAGGTEEEAQGNRIRDRQRAMVRDLLETGDFLNCMAIQFMRWGVSMR